MQWNEVRQAHPDQWLVIEALEAHTEQNQRRLDRLAVVELCADGQAALPSYRRLHQQYPQREFYFAHTSREPLTILERHWAGVRPRSLTLTLSLRERGQAAFSPRPFWERGRG